jgi:predicted MFS family arabinose efflux permease
MTGRQNGAENARGLACLYSVIFAGSFSYSLILPLLPELLRSFGKSAAIGGVLASIPPAMSLVCAPALGYLSDKTSRKLVLLITVAGTVIAYLVFGLWNSFTGLILSRALAGAMAGNIAVVQAAVAEQSSTSFRGTAMGRLTAAWGCGFVLGPALTAALAHLFDRNIVFLLGMAAAAYAAITFVAILFNYHESSDHSSPPEPNNQQLNLPGAIPISSPLRTILFLALLAFCQTGLLAMTGFLLQTVFGWSAQQIGLVMFGTAIAIVLVQSIVIPRLLASFDELQVSRASLTVTALAAPAIHFAHHSAPLVVACVITLFTGITMTQTALNTLLSKCAGAARRGLVMGHSNAAASLGRIVGPAAFGLLFIVEPTAPYLAASVILLALLLLARPANWEVTVSHGPA